MEAKASDVISSSAFSGSVYPLLRAAAETWAASLQRVWSLRLRIETWFEWILYLRTTSLRFAILKCSEIRKHRS